VTLYDDDLEERERMLNRFRRLMGELMRGQIGRNSFTSWEIEILLDFDACELEPRRRDDIVKQYQRAVEKQLETGPGPPMKLSHFLVLRSQRQSSVR
jgi:hypothetical protein